MRHPKARLRVRQNVGPLAEAEIVKLVRAVENLFVRETCVGPCTYRQDPMVRVLVKNQAERVAALFLRRPAE